MDDGTKERAIKRTARRIRLAREMAGHSVESFAEQTGIPGRTLIDMERGEVWPSQMQLNQIACATGMPIFWFQIQDESPLTAAAAEQNAKFVECLLLLQSLRDTDAVAGLHLVLSAAAKEYLNDEGAAN
ncbi:MAG: helix-turn-helix transcriptional regulator [Pseudomonadota bacterium]